MPAIPNYQSAIKYLFDRVDFEKTSPRRVGPDSFKLDRARALMDALGNPQDAILTAHVAGTKGKGSTCEMAASCAAACGYRVGLYTSPHLVDLRERIRINGEPIRQVEVTRTMRKVAEAAAAVEPTHDKPTFFELLTAAAFVYFHDQKVDLAVIEVGLGGRLDATNVIRKPAVTVVTSIGLDHTHILGETRGLIAREKAGIFKPGVPAITIKNDDEPQAALSEVAEAVGAPFKVLGEGQDIDFSLWFNAAPGKPPNARVSLTTPRSSFEHLEVPLKGHHQAYNCGLALAILDALTEHGLTFPETRVAAGLAATPTAGRLELAWRSPRILLDGAHNAESLDAVFKAIGAYIPYDSLVVVFGCSIDKPIDAMLGQLDKGADKVIFTKTSNNPRAADPNDLARRFSNISGTMLQVEPNLKDAINAAARAVATDDLICVTGSFYLAGEAKKLLLDLAKKTPTPAR